MTDIPDTPMTSNRPYLIRAMYEWIGDNDMTPYLLVDASMPGVHVPPAAVKDGKVVLNIAARATSRLELGNELIHFQARFGGVSQAIELPVAAVQAIYAHETGQGMLMPPESEDLQGDGPGSDQQDMPPEPPKRGAHLRVVK